GAFCTHLFGLFRSVQHDSESAARTSSEPSAERHHGMTYFLVNLQAAGATVRPVGRLDGDDGFAEVFLDDVFVPDRDVLGAVGDGWNVAMATTSSERGLTLRSPGRFTATAARLVELLRRRRSSADPSLIDRIVKAFIDAEAYRLYTFRTVTRM